MLTTFKPRFEQLESRDTPSMTFVTPPALHPWVINAQYSLVQPPLQVQGNVGPVLFSEVGTMPPGISLNGDGSFAGKCPIYGNYSFTVTAVDGIGDTVSQVFTVSLQFSRTGGPLHIGNR